MLIAWMIYAVAITTIVAGSAIALDRVAEIWKLSRRAVWIAALCVAIGVPAGLALRPVQTTPVAPAVNAGSREPQRFTAEAFAGRVGASNIKITREFSLTRLPRALALPPFLNRTAGLAWLATSLVIAGLLLRGAMTLWRRQDRWNRTVVDGHSVLLTNDIGPAVVGVLRPRILLPAWALALGIDERMLVLEHEAQHVRAKDPMLIAAAAWAVALFPWNPALWLIVKRLRLAIEIDCDARVLAGRTSDVRDYGMLLLAIGSRSGNALRLGVSLAEPRRFLEQRILAMTTPRPTRPLVASTPFVAIALIAGVAVAQTPRPDSTLIVRRTAAPATPPRLTLTRDTVSMREPPRVVRATPPAVERVPQLREDQRVAQVSEPPKVVAINAATTQPPPISIDLIRAWIAARHPSVIVGDDHVNAVTIVVDANNRFLASVVDSLETEPTGKAPVLLVRGKLVGEPTGATSDIRPPKPYPMIIVDGVRVDSTAQLDTISIESIDVLKGKSVTDVYGREALNGVVVIRSTRPADAQLQRLGVASDNIKEMTELRLRAGVIGPNRLYVAVLQLKKY